MDATTTYRIQYGGIQVTLCEERQSLCRGEVQLNGLGLTFERTNSRRLLNNNFRMICIAQGLYIFFRLVQQIYTYK